VTSSDGDSDSSSEEDSDEDKKETAKERRKRKAKEEKKKQGLSEAPKPTRQIGGVAVTESQGANVVQAEQEAQSKPAQSSDLMDLFSATPTTTNQPGQQQQASGFAFMQ
jgi:hypothetical protein